MEEPFSVNSKAQEGIIKHLLQVGGDYSYHITKSVEEYKKESRRHVNNYLGRWREEGLLKSERLRKGNFLIKFYWINFENERVLRFLHRNFKTVGEGRASYLLFQGVLMAVKDSQKRELIEGNSYLKTIRNFPITRLSNYTLELRSSSDELSSLSTIGQMLLYTHGAAKKSLMRKFFSLSDAQDMIEKTEALSKLLILMNFYVKCLLCLQGLTELKREGEVNVLGDKLELSEGQKAFLTSLPIEDLKKDMREKAEDLKGKLDPLYRNMEKHRMLEFKASVRHLKEEIGEEKLRELFEEAMEEKKKRAGIPFFHLLRKVLYSTS